MNKQPAPRPMRAPLGGDGAHASPAAPVLPPNDAMVRELAHVVRELTRVYEQLDVCVGSMRTAMRRADTDAIAGAIAQQSALVTKVSEIEKRRVRVVDQLAGRLGARTRGQTSVTWIADRCAPMDRASLGNAAQHLRGLIERVTRDNASCRASAEALSRHMEGVIRQVAGRLNHGRMYCATGSMSDAQHVVSSIDISS